MISLAICYARRISCVNIFARYKYDLFCMQINSRIEAPCVNGNADRIRIANYDTVLNSRIFILVQAVSLLRSEHSVRKEIDAL